MKTIIHVNRAKLASNRKSGHREPVITVKTYKSNRYANEVVIYDSQGVAVARVVYRPDKPLSCGAQVWVEAYHQVAVL